MRSALCRSGETRLEPIVAANAEWQSALRRSFGDNEAAAHIRDDGGMDARAYSQDLRDRVIEAAPAGLSARGAAERFGIGDATAIVWVRRARDTDERTARKQGPPKGSKLDPHRDYLLALIEATPDLTISELLAKLLEERQVRAARAPLWVFLDRCGLTYKKRPRMRASETAPTS